MGRAYEVRKSAMAKSSAAKAKLYSRYGKEIFQAAKTGVPDPEMNITLKRLVEKAKKDQVPADVVKRAIDKASSGLGDDYTNNRYEGFGPNGSTIIIDCMTDNVNRTISDVRHCFTKSNNKIGVTGSVSHMYNEWAIISFTGLTEEETLETLLMAEIDIVDVEDEDGLITVYGLSQDLYNIKTTLEESSDINIEFDEISMVPMNHVTLEGEDLDSFNKLVSMLDEIDDVDQVYHNVQLDEE